MIARLGVVLATVITAVGALGLATWLELDRATGTPVFVPVRVMRADGDRVTLTLEGDLSQHMHSPDESAADYLRLTLDGDGRVVGGQRQAPEPGVLALRIRNSTIAPMSTRLPVADHESVRFLRLLVTPAGEGYDAGLADENLHLLGRADRLW